MANLVVGRKSGFIQRGGARRRETVWIDSIGGWSEQNIATGGAVLLGSLSTLALALRPFTIVRTRGMLQVNSDQGALSERQLGAYGFAVVSEQAVAIGITAVPTPITDGGSDLWFLYEYFASMEFVQTAVGIATYRGVKFDSKAMRKVEDGQDVVEVVELDGLSDGATFSSAFRMLLKLH